MLAGWGELWLLCWRVVCSRGSGANGGGSGRLFCGIHEVGQRIPSTDQHTEKRLEKTTVTSACVLEVLK